MSTYDLYGSASKTPEELRDEVGTALRIEFEERESSYLGGTYYRSGALVGEHLVIQANRPDEEGDLPEAEYLSFQTLLEVNESPRADDIRASLTSVSGLVFLSDARRLVD